MRLKRFTLPLLVLWLCFLKLEQIHGQCSTVTFNSVGTPCTGAPVEFANSTSGSHAFQWDFCTDEFNTPSIDTTQFPTSGIFGTTAGAEFAA
ncbi:MAG: hypothetical protein ACKO1U_04095, partial [Bacteroidota bacterium]